MYKRTLSQIFKLVHTLSEDDLKYLYDRLEEFLQRVATHRECNL